MQDGGSERSRARFFDRFVTIFVFHNFLRLGSDRFCQNGSLPYSSNSKYHDFLLLFSTAYLLAYLPTCISAYLLAYLPAYLLACLPSCLAAYLPAYLPTYLPTYP